jgi:hypothetical protein
MIMHWLSFLFQCKILEKDYLSWASLWERGAYVHMLRAQAISVLKELATDGLIDTTWVSIEERKLGIFELKVKGSCERSAIDPFRQKHKLQLEENKPKGWLTIY